LGVTVIVATIGAFVGFNAVKLPILPLPFNANPIDGALFVHVYTILPPVVGLVKFTAAVEAPAHTTWFETTLTVAVGFTVIVNVTGVPAQPAATGVAVIVATIGAVVALVAVKLAISPVPLAARPIAGLELVQLITVPGADPVNVIGTVAAPLQYALLLIVVKIGVGLTVIVKTLGAPVQVVVITWL